MGIDEWNLAVLNGAVGSDVCVMVSCGCDFDQVCALGLWRFGASFVLLCLGLLRGK